MANEVERVGEQKMEMKRIECPEERCVCFSERRVSLFKNASKLCSLTGAQLAIVVFSPVGKPYLFAHPSVDAVIERYYDFSTTAASASAAASEVTTPRPAGDPVRRVNSQCERLRKAVAAEARRRDELDAAARAAGVWTSDDVRSWGMPRLVAMLAALERVQAEVAERAHEMFTEEAMMVQRYAAATVASSDAFLYDLSHGSLTVGGGANSSRQGGMDTQTTILLGDSVVSQAAHAPLPAFPSTTMLPPDLLPLSQQLQPSKLWI